MPEAKEPTKNKEDEKPIIVVSKTDGKLLKAIDELVKVTKENSGDSSSGTVNNTSSTVNNMTAQNRGGDSNIPMGLSDPQVKLIAMDAD